MNEVKNAIDQIRSELPDGILEPQVTKARNSSQPIAYYAVETDDMTMEQLSWFVDDTVTKRLLSVDGMAEVVRSGGVDREILVTLDPERMQAAGVAAAQVNQALKQLNTNAAGGRAESAAPASPSACSAMRVMPMPCRRPMSRWAAGARSSWRILPMCAIPLVK